eukprot:2218631-Amphidinium_carterae.1
MGVIVEAKMFDVLRADKLKLFCRFTTVVGVITLLADVLVDAHVWFGDWQGQGVTTARETQA